MPKNKIKPISKQLDKIAIMLEKNHQWLDLKGIQQFFEKIKTKVIIENGQFGAGYLNDDSFFHEKDITVF